MIKHKPKIIHISCHGDSYHDDTLDKYLYYLAIESRKVRGKMDDYNEIRLKKLLCGESKSTKLVQSPVKLVFVSACHSEMIGQ
jgi:CHAT domain-containing protein